ncbi:MAG: metal ABC transporter permease [Myxococcales bacterium]|nr:metal ABC transporter permease [Myxococcales bacterium]
MTIMLQFMLPALVACLVLTGIHVYLGLHVLARGVIFVDLALAQVAALGATFAILWGMAADTAPAYFISLGFTCAGALLFTAARSLADRVPVEAIIGIVYAVTSAVSILVANQLPHGADEIRELLARDLLTVTWEHIGRTAAIYAVVGAVHFVFRRQFFLVSTDPDEARRQGISVPFWDLCFYLSFGLVITSSVSIGGVLIVFSFLVIPTVIAALFLRGMNARLLAGWGVGTLGSALGMVASLWLDLPTGPCVVATFGGLLLVAAVAAQFYKPLAGAPS